MKRSKKRAMERVCYFIIGVWMYGLANHRLFAEPGLSKESLTTRISRNYLKSFAISNTPARPVSISSFDRKQGKKGFSVPEGKVRLAESTQRKVVLRTLFSAIDANHLTKEEDLLNYHAWTDLMLFCGPATHPSYHLLSRINRTTTVLGECALATLLVTPTSNINVLSSRQQTIRFLMDQPDCLSNLQQALQTYRKIEPSLLSFWTPTDPLYTREYQEYMYNRFFSSDSKVNKVARKLNRRILWRNCRDIYGEFLMVPLIGAGYCASHYLMTSISSKGGFAQSNFKDSFASFPFFIPGVSIAVVVDNYLNADKPLFYPLIGAGLFNAAAIWRGYCGVKKYKEYGSVFRNLSDRMRDVQIFMQTIQKISTIVQDHPVLEGVYGSFLYKTRKLLASSKELTEEGIMVNNLLTMKFDNWSYMQGNGGKLLATYKLFEEHKNCLEAAMYELGQLDSFMGIASLVKEAGQAHPLRCYAFTSFVDRLQQTVPSMQLEGMWNPLMDPYTVVDNDVTLHAHNVRNMVLLGANGGGKSLFISGTTISLLLSQTFGIAPAKTAVITPFDKIRTYIEVGDDIASGSSLFMVEVGRMKEYINLLKTSKPDEFIFSVADELFSRTNPTQGSAVAYSVLSAVAQHPNALHIIASHYPILMDLEHNVKGGGFKNFKVLAEETPDKKLYYTYKIMPGAPTQAVALKIIEEEGYDKELVEEAKYIIQNPEKFHKDFNKNPLKLQVKVKR